MQCSQHTYHLRGIFLLMALFLAATVPLCAQSGWSAVESGTTVSLNGISGWMTDSLFLLRVVGDSGTLLQSSDNGSTWAEIPSVPTGADLRAIGFPLPDTGYIAGEGGEIFRILRVGGEYQFERASRTDSASPGGQAGVNGISLIPSTVSAYAVGDSGTLLRTINRGRTWFIQNPGTTKNIRDVWMRYVSLIHVCGDSGLIMTSPRSGTWNLATLPGPYRMTNYHTVGGRYDTVWVAGEGGTVLTSVNAGGIWFPETTNTTVTLRGSFFSGSSGRSWIVGDSGTILVRDDSVGVWERQESGTTENLRDIVFLDETHGYIVGENGTILRTSSGGEYRPLSPSPARLLYGPVIIGSTRTGLLTLSNVTDLSLDITDVSSSNPKFLPAPSGASVPPGGTVTFSIGYSPTDASTDSSVLTIQVNEGTFSLGVPVSGWGVDSLGQPAWTWLNPIPQGDILTDIGWFDALHGMAVGEAGTVIRTSDGGQTWNASHYVSGLKSSLLDLEIIDDHHAFVVGDHGIMMATSDRGINWSVRPESGPLERLIGTSFSDSVFGSVIGLLDPAKGGPVLSAYRTTDGGNHWIDMMTRSQWDPASYRYDTPQSISAITADSIVLVGYTGYHGLILRTTDAGNSWSRSVIGSHPLRSVAFIDPTTGVAVGDGGTILRTTDAGANWDSVFSPAVDDLVDVAFYDDARGMAVGAGGVILSTNDGGLNWDARHVSGIDAWEAVAFADAEHAVVLGVRPIEYSWLVDPVGSQFPQVAYATTDGGDTWEETGTSIERHSVRSVSFRDADNGVAVCEAGEILKTSDAGEHWSVLSEGTLLSHVKHPFTSVSYVQPDQITIVGYFGTILRSPDGGSSWSEQVSGTAAHLWAVSYGDPLNGYAVGDGGTILRTTDGGSTWMSQMTSYRNGFRGVSLTGSLGIVVVGQGGLILRTTDAGRHWSRLPEKTHHPLWDVSFTGELGIAVGEGGTVLSTVDGGSTWESMTVDPEVILLGVRLSPTGNGTAVGSGGSIFVTTDTGKTWVSAPSGTGSMFYDVAFVDDQVGTVVGAGGTILRTTTGGLPLAGLTDVPPAIFPLQFGLEQNYPNPFNPATTLTYSLPGGSLVHLRIFNVLGQEVSILVNEFKEAGTYTVEWDASMFPSGVYFYRVTAGNFSETRKMLLMR